MTAHVVTFLLLGAYLLLLGSRCFAQQGEISLIEAAETIGGPAGATLGAQQPNMEEPLEKATIDCQRKRYTYRVTQADENGKQCWDTLQVWACWGRCDSNEISDWRFPYKKSSHPVCVHHSRNRAFVILRNCEDGAAVTARRYEYLEAASCHCQQCSSSDTSCEGLRYRPHRSYPDIGFGQ